MVMVMVVTKRNDQVLQLGKEEKQKPSVDQGLGIKYIFVLALVYLGSIAIL